MLKLIVILLAGILLCCQSAKMQAGPIGAQKSSNSKSLLGYLYQTSNMLNCYFTLEKNVLREPDALGRDIDIAYTKRPATVIAFVKNLQSLQTTYIVAIDQRNPRIIHLIDGHLATEKNYVLSQRVNFVYSGKLNGIPDKLGQELSNRIQKKNEFVNGAEIIVDDNLTEVAVNAKNVPVRNILTDCVPLRNYDRLLWTAETYRSEGTTKTRICYSGEASLKRN